MLADRLMGVLIACCSGKSMTERPKSVTEDVDDLDINCYSWQSRQFKLCTCKRQQKIYYNNLYDFNELYNYYTLLKVIITELSLIQPPQRTVYPQQDIFCSLNDTVHFICKYD